MLTIKLHTIQGAWMETEASPSSEQARWVVVSVAFRIRLSCWT